ncbi:MAG: hypothetical protein FWF10_03075 [Clostridiales bacterium]|nr:hypothetical protein [Clostridiales bacterium]
MHRFDKILLYALLLYIIAVAIACNLTPPDKEGTASPAPMEMTEVPSPVYEGEDAEINKITIYDMSRDQFRRFIENPVADILETGEVSVYVYPRDGEVFYRGMASPFRVNTALLDFAGSKAELALYLSQNGIIADIESTAMMYTKKTWYTSMPSMVIWVKTNRGDFFISVEEVVPDLNSIPVKYNDWYAEYFSYIYELYKQSDYCDEFASLIP